MITKTLLPVLLPAAWLAAGCIETVDIDRNRSLVLDAEQRVVLVKQSPEGPRLVTMADAGPAQAPGAPSSAQAIRSMAMGDEPRTEEVGTTSKRLVCAEPSPDALTALAAAGSLSIGVNGQGGSAGGGLNEAAAFAGRTGTIQIIRDLGYRACEGVMNGVIGAGGYNRIIDGVASTVLGLAAVEGLTGMRLGDATTISAQAPTVTTSTTLRPPASNLRGGGDGPGDGAAGETRIDIKPTPQAATTPSQAPSTPATVPASEAVVKVVCLATSGTIRDPATRIGLFKLCLGQGDASETSTGAGSRIVAKKGASG